MISIRKLVVGAGMAAGIFALSASVMPVQAREASSTPVATQFTPSAACTAAINSIKAAAANDRSEDLAERNIARTVGTDAVDQSEDATEHAGFVALFKAARTACFPAGAPETTFTHKSFTLSASCTAALQALKAGWAAHDTWQQFQALGQAARTACGWTWSTRH